jgi:hypothetical protein
VVAAGEPQVLADVLAAQVVALRLGKDLRVAVRASQADDHLVTGFMVFPLQRSSTGEHGSRNLQQPPDFLLLRQQTAVEH